MFYNKILENLVLPCAGVLIGESFIKNLKRIRKYDTLNEGELEDLQNTKLSKLLSHSLNNSLYYKHHNIILQSDPVLTLKQFPILEKKVIRQSSTEILTHHQKLIERKSSGSSGFQTTVYMNKKEQSLQRAYQIHWWEWNGYKMGQPIIQTGITPNRHFVKKIKDLLLRTYYLKAFTHDEASVLHALKWANAKKNVFLGGYASSLFVLSKIARKNNLDTRFTGAVSWGDKLFDHYKRDVKSTFSVDIAETYGSSEGFLIAAQKDLPYMYIMSPHVYLEIVDDDGNDVEDGQWGNVLVTSLDAYTMPLIRYRIGDLAMKLPKNEYPKKRDMAYPLLKKVIGRDTDLVKTRSGKYMVVHSFTGIFEHYKEIEQYCIVQKELDGIELLYIPSEDYKSEVLNSIKDSILEHLQEPSFYINFTEVGKIEPTSSGKPQIIKSFLKKDSLEKSEEL